MSLLIVCAVMIVMIAVLGYWLSNKEMENSLLRCDKLSLTSQKNQLVEENNKLRKQVKEMRVAEMIDKFGAVPKAYEDAAAASLSEPLRTNGAIETRKDFS